MNLLVHKPMDIDSHSPSHSSHVDGFPAATQSPQGTCHGANWCAGPQCANHNVNTLSICERLGPFIGRLAAQSEHFNATRSQRFHSFEELAVASRSKDSGN